MMNELLSLFEQVCPLSASTIEQLQASVSLKKAPSSTTLLPRLHICKEVYWIKSGILRGYVYENDQEVTTWFAVPGDMVMGVSSFVTQTPSVEAIEVLEEAKMYRMSYHELQKLYQCSPEMNMIGRIYMEQYYIMLEKRAFSLQYHEAKTRYDLFMKRYPELMQKVPLGIIASYLGVTPSSLSRIRKMK